MGEGFLKRRLKLRTEKGSEHVHRIADGRWVRIRESRTPDGGRVLLTTDITEERHRAAQLRLLALAVEQAGDPVEITDADHGFTYVNQAFETTTGYSPGRGARPRAAARPLERPARAGVLRRDAPPARGRPHLARHHRQPAPRRPPDRAGDHDRAAARRVRRHHPLRRGQARRHRRARPGAGARGERGALPRRRRHPDRVHRPRRRRRLLDLHERGGRALHRHDARGDARQGPARHRPDPARGPRGLRAPHGAHHARAPDQHGRAARPPPGRQRALGALDRHRHLRRRRQAGRDPVRRTRDHRPQARRGGARGGRAAAARGARGGARLLHRRRRRPGTSSSSMPPPSGPSAMRAPRRSASRWPS